VTLPVRETGSVTLGEYEIVPEAVDDEVAEALLVSDTESHAVSEIDAEEEVLRERLTLAVQCELTEKLGDECGEGDWRGEMDGEGVEDSDAVEQPLSERLLDTAGVGERLVV
jgi:hypothetical protein